MTAGWERSSQDVDSLLRRPERIYRGYLFDLDGTIYLGRELLPGAAAMLDELRSTAAKLVFLSNNPTRDPQMYVDKLAGLGIAAGLHEILNTVVTMTAWLRRACRRQEDLRDR